VTKTPPFLVDFETAEKDEGQRCAETLVRLLLFAGNAAGNAAVIHLTAGPEQHQ
jgi:hypothetical protein